MNYLIQNSIFKNKWQNDNILMQKTKSVQVLDCEQMALMLYGLCSPSAKEVKKFV